MSRMTQLADVAARARQGTGTAPLDDRALAGLLGTMARVRDAREAPSVLRASGVKIERMSADNLRIAAGNRQAWQALAWRYRDMIPELRQALQFRARAISQVRFYVAEIIDDDDEPIAVSLRNDKDPDVAKRVTLPAALCQQAEDELNRLPLDAGMAFLGTWSENYDVTGDCWLHGYIDPVTETEVWKIRAVSAIDVQGSQLTVKNELGQPRQINLETEELYRLWVPHPEQPHLGDSALNAMQDVLEDICLAGREMRAGSRSRIMNNGTLFMPDSMAQVRNLQDEDDTPENRRDQWMTNFTAAMLAPITNEGDAGGVVPMVLTGTPDEIKAVRYERFDREDAPNLLDKLAAALGRMGNGLDIPPEILTGMADANHWSAWQIDNSTFRYHLEPGIRVMVDSLTTAYLRTVLAKTWPADMVRRVRVWFDAGQITENPNRRQDALDALDRILIGPKAGRSALGFNEGDAPTPEEALQLIAAKNGIDQATAASILAWAARAEGATALPPMPVAKQIEPSTAPTVDPAPQAAPDPAGIGGTGAPNTTPEGITASLQLAREEAHRRHGGDWADIRARTNQQAITAATTPPATHHIDWTAARDLHDLDTALRDHIHHTIDHTARQALTRANNRLRSKTLSPKLGDTLRTQLQSKPVTEWAAHLGPEQCFALGADTRFLLAGAWESLSGKFAGWVRDYAGKVSRRVLKMLGVGANTIEGRAVARQLQVEMEARVVPAWAHLQDALDVHLEKLLFDDVPDEVQVGERSHLLIPPGLIREALAEVGGDLRDQDVPVTGLTNGSSVRGVLRDRGAIHVGMEWRYGYAARSTFQAHEDLDGERFLTWHDSVLKTDTEDSWIGPFYRPGDHRGCLCSWSSVYALPRGGTPSLVFAAGDLPSGLLPGLQREYLDGAR